MFSEYFCDCKKNNENDSFSVFLNYVLMMFISGGLIQATFKRFTVLSSKKENVGLDPILENLVEDNEDEEDEEDTLKNVDISEISDEE